MADILQHRYSGRFQGSKSTTFVRCQPQVIKHTEVLRNRHVRSVRLQAKDMNGLPVLVEITVPNVDELITDLYVAKEWVVHDLDP